jgi:GT2 family glycosyltransferase
MILPGSSLIIGTRNRPRLLAETVASVLGGNTLPDELIIVDQSELPHPDLMEQNRHKDCQIRYIRSDTAGVSRARNEGLNTAIHDQLIIIDDDMQAPKEWFGNILRELIDAGQNSVITGQVLPGAVEQSGGFVPATIVSNQPQTFRGRISTDVLVSCNMAMHSSTFYKIGGFDERLGPGTRFPAAEDNDYGYRLLEAGFEIRYSPEASIFHRAWRGGKEYFSSRWGYGRGKGGFYTKHSRLIDGFMLRRMLGDVFIRFTRFPWRFIHKPRLAIGDLYYAFGIIVGSIDWFVSYSTTGK